MNYYVYKKGPTEQGWTEVNGYPNSDKALDFARCLKKKLGEGWRTKIVSEEYRKVLDRRNKRGRYEMPRRAYSYR